LVTDGQRRSSGLLIPIILIVGLAGAVSFGWWWRARPRVPFEPMPRETPAKVAELVAKGDRLFLEAMDHVNKSDPERNPNWPAENRKALEHFNESRVSYGLAQDEYISGQSPPAALLDRFREAIQRYYFCRKRATVPRR
jgi:hypothetical protein